MLSFNNLDSEDTSYIIKKLFPTNAKEFTTLPTLYQMTEPYRMQIIHFRPEEEEHYFSTTYLSPDNVIYNILEKTKLVCV